MEEAGGKRREGDRMKQGEIGVQSGESRAEGAGRKFAVYLVYMYSPHSGFRWGGTWWGDFNGVST